MKNKLQDLRNHLFATLEALQDNDNPMDVARAKAVAEVAGVVISTAKLEIDYAEALGLIPGSDFVALDTDPDSEHLPPAPRRLNHQRVQ
jgi:hypothetical protein